MHFDAASPTSVTVVDAASPPLGWPQACAVRPETVGLKWIEKRVFWLNIFSLKRRKQASKGRSCNVDAM
jgi:hypothetical protein